MHRRLALVAILLAASCDGGSSSRGTSFAVIAPDGTNPFVGKMLASVRATYRQDLPGFVDTSVTSSIVGETFDLVVPVATVDAAMHLSLAIDDASGVALVGSAPPFFPGSSATVNIVVGAPGTCAIVPALALPTPREHLGAVLVGEYLLVAGGDEASGPSSTIEAFDLLSLTHVAMPPADSPLGPTRAVALDRTRALFVPSDRPSFVQRLVSTDVASARSEPTIHAGGGATSALAAHPDGGAALIGGGDATAPSAEATWILASESTQPMELPAPVFGLAAAGATIGIMVYANDGVSSAQLWHLQSATMPVYVRSMSLGVDGVRNAPSMYARFTGAELMVFGGLDASNTIRSDTRLIGNCPAECYASAGPTWTTARDGFAFDPATGVIAGGAGPSGLVERTVLWTMTSPAGDGVLVQGAIVPFATLVHPRTNAAVVSIDGGPVLVLGGRDATGLVADTEICFPP